MIWFLLAIGVGLFALLIVEFKREAYLQRRIERLQFAANIALQYTMEQDDRDRIVAALEYSKGLSA